MYATGPQTYAAHHQFRGHRLEYNTSNILNYSLISLGILRRVALSAHHFNGPLDNFHNFLRFYIQTQIVLHVLSRARSFVILAKKLQQKINKNNKFSRCLNNSCVVVLDI